MKTILEHRPLNRSQLRSVAKVSLLVCALLFTSLSPSRGAVLFQQIQDAMDGLLLRSNSTLGLSITVQPVNQTVLPGLGAALSVAATGPDLQYQWTVNGDVIPGATSPILVLNNVLKDICGSYQAIVYNDLDMDWSMPAYVQLVAPALPFADSFTNRGVVNTLVGFGSSSNTIATTEKADPKLATGWLYHTMWMTWVAPISGRAHLETTGSAFDSWLGVYTGTVQSNLVAVATDDDDGGLHTSAVDFNAQAGTAYQVVVASHDYTGGPILFGWNLVPSLVPLPTITVSPTNITKQIGAPASLSFQYSATVPVSIEWYHNGQRITGANQSSLQWSQLGLADLGSYQANLVSLHWVFPLPPVEIQFNSEGLSSVAARNKLTDAVKFGLIGQ